MDIAKDGLQFGTITELLAAITTLLSVIIGAIVSWEIFKQEPSRTYTKERYEKVIFPIFQILENYLFEKTITPEVENVIFICKEIIKENKLIAGGKLTEVFSRRITSENFYEMSLEIDTQYDKACKQLGIPVRSFFYKLSQYGWKCKKLNVRFALYIICCLFIGIGIIFIFLIFSGLILMLLEALLKSIAQPK